jgi:hypothetical protein
VETRGRLRQEGLGSWIVNLPTGPQPLERGTIIEHGRRPNHEPYLFVILTDPSLAILLDGTPHLGAVLLSDQRLPDNGLYPPVIGRSGETTGNRIRGMWRARPDRIAALSMTELVTYGPVTGEELAAIDAAVLRFLAA